MITLSSDEVVQLSGMREQARSGQIGYWKIYEFLANLLSTKYAVPVSDSTVLWLRGATEANAGRGTFSELIREYTSTQYKLRYGSELSSSAMQQASNNVAENLLSDILGDNAPQWPPGRVPDIARIAFADATAVGQTLFGPLLGHDLSDTAFSQNSAWSGSLLFSLLSSNQTSRLLSTGASANSVDTLNDVRDVLYAAVSYQAALKAAALLWPVEGQAQRGADSGILGNTIAAYVTTPTNAGLLTTLRLGATGTVGEAFKVVADIGAHNFLSMLNRPGF